MAGFLASQELIVTVYSTYRYANMRYVYLCLWISQKLLLYELNRKNMVIANIMLSAYERVF